ncbi:MAG TPA: hypothetical protein V6C91_22690 [Coleofasciculaceae cyanobacterium]
MATSANILPLSRIQEECTRPIEAVRFFAIAFIYTNLAQLATRYQQVSCQVRVAS